MNATSSRGEVSGCRRFGGGDKGLFPAVHRVGEVRNVSGWVGGLERVGEVGGRRMRIPCSAVPTVLLLLLPLPYSCCPCCARLLLPLP